MRDFPNQSFWHAFDGPSIQTRSGGFPNFQSDMSAVTARQEPRELRAFRHTEYLPCSFVWRPIVPNESFGPEARRRGCWLGCLSALAMPTYAPTLPRFLFKTTKCPLVAW